MRKYKIEKLHIRKKTLPQLLTYYIFLVPFAFGFLLDLLSLPSFVKYTIDVAWVGLIILTVRRKKMCFNRKILPFVVVVSVFFIYALFGYLFHFQSVAYFLWGFRNNFRFFVAFFAFATFFDEYDTAACLRILDSLFWINVVLSLIQFFLLGYEQDFLGGIFGVERGSNAYSTVFFSIVLSKSILSMMNGTEKLLSCMLKCAAALMTAVLAELFAFFLIFAVILVTATVLTKFSWKKCLLYAIMGLALSICSMYLVELFGAGSAISLDVIYKRLLSANYATSDDLGRLTAIPIISKRFLTDLPGQLFGLGLGNCDTSTFEICNTPFFKSHERLHYTWFMSAFLYLETGYVGLAIYLGFFVMSFIVAVRKIRSSGNLLHHQLAAVMSILCVIFTFYNSSLRTEAGYMVYFSLALPFIRPAVSKLKSGNEDSSLTEKTATEIAPVVENESLTAAKP